jgi:hypothetical protein
MPGLEIWLTSLVSEPRIHAADDLVRVYLNASDDFDGVLQDHGKEVPAPLDEHLRLLWAGPCPGRSFEIVDEHTVVIRTNTAEVATRQRLTD